MHSNKSMGGNLKAGFGDYWQAHRKKVGNSMTTRADGGITLYDSGNIEGSWYIFNLNTNCRIKRNQFDILPIPQIVIDEAWSTIDDDLSDEETVSEGGHQDNELGKSTFKDIRNINDNVSEMASEDEPLEEGPGEKPYNIGDRFLRS